MYPPSVNTPFSNGALGQASASYHSPEVSKPAALPLVLYRLQAISARLGEANTGCRKFIERAAGKDPESKAAVGNCSLQEGQETPIIEAIAQALNILEDRVRTAEFAVHDLERIV